MLSNLSDGPLTGKSRLNEEESAEYQIPSAADKFSKIPTKQLKHVNGGTTQISHIAMKHMDCLLMAPALMKSEKEMLKQAQLSSVMIRYNPPEESDEEGDAVSVNSAEMGDDMNNETVSERVQEVHQILMKGMQSMKTNNIVPREQGLSEFQAKETITIKQMLTYLKRKEWLYIPHLIGFLKLYNPLIYNSIPGFFDEMSSILVMMNEGSVPDLLTIYQLSTLWLQEAYPGKCARFSKLRPKAEHTGGFEQGMHPLMAFDATHRYVQKRLKLTPQGAFTIEVKTAVFQIPLNIAFGSSYSVRFLKSLEKAQDKRILELPVVQGYLAVKWKQAWPLYALEVGLHILLLIIYSIYIVQDYFRDSLLVELIILVLCAGGLMKQMLQFIDQKVRYFMDILNALDLGSLVVTVMSLFVDGDKFRWISVIALLVLYGRALTYFRLVRSTRLLVRSLIEIAYDILPLLAMYIVLIIAFSVTYIACYPLSSNLSYSIRLWRGYELFLGGYEDPENGPHYLMLTVVSLVTIIVMLNVLIAHMTETFLRVYASPVYYDSLERLAVLVDLESVFRPCCYKSRKMKHIAITRRPEDFPEFEESADTYYKNLKKKLGEIERLIREK